MFDVQIPGKMNIEHRTLNIEVLPGRGKGSQPLSKAGQNEFNANCRIHVAASRVLPGQGKGSCSGRFGCFEGDGVEMHSRLNQFGEKLGKRFLNWREGKL